MKKKFLLQAPGKDDARVRDKIRHEVNKYVRRARQQTLPEGFGQWDFSCRLGPDAASAEPCALKEVAGGIDAVAAAGSTEVYIEITAVAAHRKMFAVAPSEPPPGTAE